MSRFNSFKWESIPFQTPLHFQLDYIYTIDEDAGHFTVTQWRTVDGALYPRTRRATLASIGETSLSTIDTLLEDVVGVSRHNDHPPRGSNNEIGVPHLLKAFEIQPSLPAQLNELQFQLFADFVFTWRFYFDDIRPGNAQLPFFCPCHWTIAHRSLGLRG